MNKESRIIFLDVDGVLNSRPQLTIEYKKRSGPDDISYHLGDIYLENLSKIYHEFEDIYIVLTSTWKEVLDSCMGELLKDKLKDFGMEIFDITADYLDGEYLSRPESILLWLNNHPEIQYWVSIEDDYNYNEYEKISVDFANHLCRTKFGFSTELESDIIKFGLNSEKTDIAISILRDNYEKRK